MRKLSKVELEALKECFEQVVDLNTILPYDTIEGWKNNNYFEQEKNIVLLEYFGLDSLEFVELIMRIEKKFEISIPDERVESIKSLWDLKKIILKEI